MVSIPGALTPTEIVSADNAGADFVKLFPITSLGASYLKAVRAPLSSVKFLAVGGINLDNIKEYLAAGALGFGIGGNIADKRLIENGDYASISELCEKYVLAVQ